MSIHPSAYVSAKATIGENVTIGAFSIVNDDVVIGNDCVIGSHCVMGEPSKLSDGTPLVIGNNSMIRSHSVFYVGSSFGDGLVTGHRVTVRENTKAGKAFQIGTLSDIQGHCVIGDFVRTHSNVHIGQKSEIGNFVWIFPYVVLTNDPHPPSNELIGCHVEDYAVIATMTVVLPGVRVGSHSLVAAHSLVSRDVQPGAVVGGVPAKFMCPAADIKLRDGSGRPAYPWPRHFSRGYPESVVDQWRAEFDDLSN